MRHPDLVLVHLYPDLLCTYGDRGNVMALARRAQWRGFRIRVDAVSRGDRLPPDAGLVFIGGGSDRLQAAVGVDLLRRRRALAEMAASGCVVVGVCGGYQILGRAYLPESGQPIEGLGLLRVETVAASGRLVGRVRAAGSLWGRSFDLTGFENHAGRTRLDEGVAPLARVTVGAGNDGADGTEGAVEGTIVGTYLHGPVLPLNPVLADLLLGKALAPVTGGGPLAPLADEVEDAAHRHALTLRR